MSPVTTSANTGQLDDGKDSKEPSAFAYVLAAIVILAGVWGLTNGLSAFLKRLRPLPPAISLSAYFVPPNDKAAHLKIKGEVRQKGNPLREGAVQLTANKQDESFQQTVAIGLNDKGQFETEDPAFGQLRPTDQIHIIAEVSSSHLSEPASQEIYLNARPPTLTSRREVALWAVGLALFVIFFWIFFWAFTGRTTPGKNRTAIILSYCIIGLSLAVPLLVPVLWLYAYPNSRCEMNIAPVGLVITSVAKENPEPQWALNIGGRATRKAVRSPSENGLPASQVTPEKPANNKSGPDNPGTEQAPQTPVNATPPNSTVEVAGKQSDPEKRDAQPADNEKAATEATACGDVVAVDGGMVIPFYVIVLSVIGGAINMTRKVPRLQREGEYSEVSLPKRAASKAASIVEATVSGTTSLLQGLLRPPSNTGQVPPPNPAPQTQSPAERRDRPSDDASTPKQSETTAARTETGTAQGEGDAGTKAGLAPGSPETPPTPAAGRTPATDIALETGKAETHEDAALAEPAANKARDIDTKLDELVKEQVQRDDVRQDVMSQIRDLVQQMRDIFDLKKDERILGFESFEDWLGNRVGLKALLGTNWRVELLNQYMYLVSAPFLAVVAYYMLQQLQLVSQQAIVVLVSFSVGLISEKIVSSILGMATGYLRSDKTNTVTP